MTKIPISNVKLNTIGFRQAGKCMHLAAIAYNLKKYLKSTTKKVRTRAKTFQNQHCTCFSVIRREIMAFKRY